MPHVLIRSLPDADLDCADRIFRTAFGTFVGMPDPQAFMGDADFVRTRWRADPASAFGAYVDASLVGSNFATNWGSVGFFGPLTVRPDLWDSGIGKRLMEPIVERFDAWGTRVAGLFTFPHSQKHVGMYQRFGFWPRFLTALMRKPVLPPAERRSLWTKFSEVPAAQREGIVKTCRALTDAVYDGLDLSREIRAASQQQLGDTVLLWRDGQLAGMAVCHSGGGTEAGSDTCYVKFGAVRPTEHAGPDFENLLCACEEFAHERGASSLVAGVNTARQEAYARMLTRGFRTDMHGVVMHRPNDAAYNRPDTLLIDDWR